MGLRIRLVEPRPAGHNVYDCVLLPRLGFPLIGKMLAGSGHDVRIYCEVLAPVDLDDLLGADLVGISSTTATAPAAYRLADLLATAGVPVVLGGPHVTFCADEALGHANYVVRGEGEQTIGELVTCLEDGRPGRGGAGALFPGWRRGAPPQPRPATLHPGGVERLPVPDLTLIEGHRRMTAKPVMTQWGCPFDCEFCSVVTMFSRVVRHRRTDQVLAELEGLSGEEVFFYDDNFVVNKARTTELLRSMCAAGLIPNWAAQGPRRCLLCSLSVPRSTMSSSP